MLKHKDCYLRGYIMTMLNGILRSHNSSGLTKKSSTADYAEDYVVA